MNIKDKNNDNFKVSDKADASEELNMKAISNEPFKNYIDDGAIEIPNLKVISDNVYQRLFDVTFGYLISSLSALLFLVALLPIYYAVHDGIASSAKALPKLMDVFDVLGAGWFVVLITAAGFFAGGVALFNSMRIGRAILKYMFTLWGLIILFEIRYSMNRSSAVENHGFLLVAIVAFLVVALIYMVYRSYRNKSIVVMVLFNSMALAANAIFIVKYFVNFSGASAADRHVHYLSLFFIAAIVMQTYEAAKTFLPLIKWNLKNPPLFKSF
ncbi:MAG TPA: hypothetical protein PKK26_01055 [Candidatus Wallbacteria bacterium]|nr:hypothetical protein [Candidatus Wallbacteria bacterium]